MGVAGDWMQPSGEGEQMEINLSEEAASEVGEAAEGESSDADLSLYESSPDAEGEQEGASPDLEDSESDSKESYYDTEVPKE